MIRYYGTHFVSILWSLYHTINHKKKKKLHKN